MDGLGEIPITLNRPYEVSVLQLFYITDISNLTFFSADSVNSGLFLPAKGKYAIINSNLEMRLMKLT